MEVDVCLRKNLRALAIRWVMVVAGLKSNLLWTIISFVNKLLSREKRVTCVFLTGFNKRLVDEILIESLEGMGRTPCKDETLPPLKRLRRNIEMLLIKTVPKDQMEKFKKESKSTEDILELLTTEKDK